MSIYEPVKNSTDSPIEDLVKKIVNELQPLPFDVEMEIFSRIRKSIIDDINNKIQYHNEQIKIHQGLLDKAKSM